MCEAFPDLYDVAHGMYRTTGFVRTWISYAVIHTIFRLCRRGLVDDNQSGQGILHDTFRRSDIRLIFSQKLQRQQYLPVDGLSRLQAVRYPGDNCLQRLGCFLNVTRRGMLMKRIVFVLHACDQHIERFVLKFFRKVVSIIKQQTDAVDLHVVNAPVGPDPVESVIDFDRLFTG